MKRKRLKFWLRESSHRSIYQYTKFIRYCILAIWHPIQNTEYKTFLRCFANSKITGKSYVTFWNKFRNSD